jgi:hypothetical protein
MLPKLYENYGTCMGNIIRKELCGFGHYFIVDFQEAQPYFSYQHSGTHALTGRYMHRRHYPKGVVWSWSLFYRQLSHVCLNTTGGCLSCWLSSPPLDSFQWPPKIYLHCSSYVFQTWPVGHNICLVRRNVFLVRSWPVCHFGLE